MIEHEQQERTQGGAFTPAASVKVLPSLRTSGLLASLPGEEVKSLLLLLTFVTTNGAIQPSLPEVAQGLRVSESKARDRLLRLQTILWQGEPLVRSRQRELGLDAYTLAPHLITVRQAPEAPAPQEIPAPRPAASSRARVVAHSRSTYARSRAEVERLVAAQLGQTGAEHADTPEGKARWGLLALGVPREYVEVLLRDHSLEVIAEQLAWLPHRHAKSPARLIVAAIENRYEPPARVRLEQAIARQEAAQQLEGAERTDAGQSMEPESVDYQDPAYEETRETRASGEIVSAPEPAPEQPEQTDNPPGLLGGHTPPAQGEVRLAIPPAAPEDPVESSNDDEG